MNLKKDRSNKIHNKEKEIIKLGQNLNPKEIGEAKPKQYTQIEVVKTYLTNCMNEIYNYENNKKEIISDFLKKAPNNKKLPESQIETLYENAFNKMIISNLININQAFLKNDHKN